MSDLAGSPVQQRSAETIDLQGRAIPLSCIFGYDTVRWPLRPAVAAFFGTDSLEQLHHDQRWNPHAEDLRLPSNQITRNSWNASKTLREAVSPETTPLLHSLTRDLISQFVGPIRSVQPLPMMRVNFHGSRAILRFHRDVEYGQSPSTINIWLPVTRVYGSNSMYVECRSNAGEFEPVELEYGQALLFYGTDLLHGTLDNVSGGTRISFDFRFSL